MTGAVYRLGLYDGKQIWKTLAPLQFRQSFTDGGMVLGPGGMAYTCSNLENGQVGSKGALRAYRVSDGTLVWDNVLAQPCVSWPAVGTLPHQDGPSVVVPIGPFPGNPSILQLAFSSRIPQWWIKLLLNLSLWLGPKKRWLWRNPVLPGEVVAFDAKTGAPQWRYEVPPWPQYGSKGNEEGLTERFRLGNGRHEQTASWGAPAISGDGTVYAGFMSGVLYAIRDSNGDGVIHGPAEVSTFDLGAAPLHPGASFAPGMMGFVSHQELFVFKV